MTPAALAIVDDVRPPETDEEIQLVLDETAFGASTLRSLIRAGAEVTPVGLDLSKIEKDLPFRQYEQLGFYLGLMNRSCMWWIGDWLIYGEGRYADRFEQALAVTGLAEQTLLNRMSVCRQIAISERRVGLSFSVHAELTALSPRDRRYWLDRAERNGWTRQQLRDAMEAKAKQGTDDTGTQTTVPGTGVADPKRVVEAAQRIVSEKRDYGADWLVPREAMAVLEAALGVEEE